MTEIVVNEVALAAAKGKVVVLTGGAQGIGAATVSTLFRAGAHVMFGDWNDEKGSLLERQLRSEQCSSGGSVVSMKVDVRSYQSQLALFDAAMAKHGRIDTAIFCAGITEPSGWFEAENLNLETVRTEPAPIDNVMTTNLNSTLYFTRIALAFMKQKSVDETASQAQNGTNPAKSITLLSSVAGFKESPGLFAYSASKHGVIGLMRGMRLYAPSKFNVRINVICPWATDTQMLAGVKKAWVDKQLPLNTPEDVARVITHVAGDSSLNGTSIFVGGGRAFDMEEGIDRLEPQWLGEEQARQLNEGQVVLGLGDDWTK